MLEDAVENKVDSLFDYMSLFMCNAFAHNIFVPMVDVLCAYFDDKVVKEIYIHHN